MAGKLTEPKLTIELVPKGQWGSNLRSKLPRTEWDRLRKAQYEVAGHICEVCGGVGRRHPVECHEVWEFEEGVQRLVGLIALCPACHGVKHIGRTMQSHWDPGGVKATAHLARVNGWTVVQAQLYIEESLVVWQRRSYQEWALDLSWLETPENPPPTVDDDLSFMDDPGWGPKK